MATSNPFASIPAGMSYPLRLAPDFGAPVPKAETASNSKKRKREPSSVIGLRYNFKPASITPDTPGTMYTEKGHRSLKFDIPTGGQQVFDAREEAGKSRECVMIWDESTQSFTLYPLSSTVHLTLNRTSSSAASSAAGPSLHPIAKSERTDSIASSSSSSAVPLAEDRKRSRASPETLPTTANRPIRSGKGVPRKQPPPSAVIPEPTKGRGKAGAKKKPSPATPAKSTKKGQSAQSVNKGKVKSIEIIIDSDEEIAGGEEDEFAMMLGQSLASGADDAGDDDDEDDDEEDEDEDEDDRAALGGAKVVLEGDGSEWL